MGEGHAETADGQNVARAEGEAAAVQSAADAGGTPDLQGVWSGAGGDNNSFLEEHEYVDVTTPAQESFISDPADGKVPYTALGAGETERDSARAGTRMARRIGRTSLRLAGIVLSERHAGDLVRPQEIVQQPGYVIMLSDETYRVIPTDGRPAFSQNAKFWFGSSRGRWEGDTLVVDVTSLNGKAWFDSTGQFYSENTRMIERWRLADANTMDYELTIEDPTIYTRPWKMNFPKRRAGTGPTGGPRGITAASGVPAAGQPTRMRRSCGKRRATRETPETSRRIRSLGFKWFTGVTPPK